MYEDTKRYKLNGKDLIGIGIYSAIYFVLTLIAMVLGSIPILWILMPGIISVIAGIPFMMLCAKIQKLCALLIMGAITGIIYFITGQFTVIILITFAVSCVLSELIRWRTNYNSFKGNVFAYILFSYGMVGSPLPIWIMKNAFFSKILQNGMNPEFVATLKAMCSNTMLIVLLVTPIIGGVLGSGIAHAMFKKHFKKAGEYQ